MHTFEALDRHLETFSGRMGACVLADDGRVLYARDADASYPAASVIKLALVMALYAEAAAGRLSLDERAVVGGRVDGTGVLRHLADVRDLSLRDLATLSLIVSDNTATNRLIERVGTEVVARHLDEWGIAGVRLERAMYDFAARDRGKDNGMSPRGTAELFLLLLRGGLVDAATSEAVLDVLHRNPYEARLLRYLPSGVWAAHKEGHVDGVRNDAGVIRVGRAVVAAGFCRDVVTFQQGDVALGILGWCAYRAAGGDAPEPVALGL